MTLAEDVRAEIRLALRVADVSQAELARRIGISTNHASRVLTGQQALSMELADAMLAAVGREWVSRTREVKGAVRT
jgi:transcriptional regulator with XRE-family HTH domain